MKRYGKIVFEAEEGITFDVSEGTSGELIIRAMNILQANVYSENYVNPPIPEGYKHVFGKWNNGFVIERSSDGSQFVWIPVGSLISNGTLDGNSFTEKFGRRNPEGAEFSERKYHETLTDELVLQVKSVKKYGGFYISRYKISVRLKGELRSVKIDNIPHISGPYILAKQGAAIVEDNEAVKSHLTFGAEWDSIREWLIQTGAECGLTGSTREGCANNLCDLIGMEWTQEQFGDSSHRYVNLSGNGFRDYYDDCSRNLRFRVALYIA